MFEEYKASDLALFFLGERMPNPRHLKVRMNRETNEYEIRIGSTLVGLVGKSLGKDKKTIFSVKLNPTTFPSYEKCPKDFATRTMAEARQELIRRIDRETYLEIWDRK